MERLKYLREHAGLTQSELGDRLGVFPSTISKYESGSNSPSPEVLCQLSKELHASVDYMLGLTDLVAPAGTYDPADERDYVSLSYGDGVRVRYVIPDDERQRFRLLLSAGLPEVFDTKIV